MDEDDDWEEMPVVRSEKAMADEELDPERAEAYYAQHRRERGTSPEIETKSVTKARDLNRFAVVGNATGHVDTTKNSTDADTQWRERGDAVKDATDYTRLQLDEDLEDEEVGTKTSFLFNENTNMTPLAQMQTTKTMLTEGQRIAYVGLCRLVVRQMLRGLFLIASNVPELQPAHKSMLTWSAKIMGRLYHHMDISPAEQKMIENLADHGIAPDDLVPALVTTHKVDNPDYDPDGSSEGGRCSRDGGDGGTSAKRDGETEETNAAERGPGSIGPSSPPLESHKAPSSPQPESHKAPHTRSTSASPRAPFASSLHMSPEARRSRLEGVTVEPTTHDKQVTLDMRWTILCDLFLLLVADSVYDARSRVLLSLIADMLGLEWLDVLRFERQLTEALELEEGVRQLESQEVLDQRRIKDSKSRLMMMGLATLGGGLVIGLSAGLLAPVIGAGLGAAFTTFGIAGTSSFLAGTGGAAIVTTSGVVSGGYVGGKAMGKRTKHVEQFALLPLHNQRRVNVYLTLSGFMNGKMDDVRLPFSTMDPVMGDVMSVLWEPHMLNETGAVLKILASEIITQVGQQVLAATVMTTLMGALQWPIMLTKLGYLIDNPWSNVLDRARQVGAVLADVLIQRQVGVRPVSLVGFSLGARVIFYALEELARQGAYGIVQEVYLFGATVSAPKKTWRKVRGIVAGRFVNAFARNDWLLGYLFRATEAGLSTVAGLRPIEGVPEIENVDVTDIVVGHLSYRNLMPVLLHHVGIRTTADHFDEPNTAGDFPDEKKSWSAFKNPFRKTKNKPTDHDLNPAADISEAANQRDTGSVPRAYDVLEDDDRNVPRDSAPRDSALSTSPNENSPGTPRVEVQNESEAATAQDSPSPPAAAALQDSPAPPADADELPHANGAVHFNEDGGSIAPSDDAPGTLAPPAEIPEHPGVLKAQDAQQYLLDNTEEAGFDLAGIREQASSITHSATLNAPTYTQDVSTPARHAPTYTEDISTGNTTAKDYAAQEGYRGLEGYSQDASPRRLPADAGDTLRQRWHSADVSGDIDMLRQGYLPQASAPAPYMEDTPSGAWIPAPDLSAEKDSASQGNALGLDLSELEETDGFATVPQAPARAPEKRQPRRKPRQPVRKEKAESVSAGRDLKDEPDHGAAKSDAVSNIWNEPSPWG